MNSTHNFNVVTGAFGYTGRYITRRLLAEGRRVRTITGHQTRANPFFGQIEVAAMDFGNPQSLVQALRGADVLFNTYWVRFAHGLSTFERAVSNSTILVQAAKEAGVRRIVHLSIANPSIHSPFPYYSGKAAVEKAIIESGVSFAILRPTVIFGPEDILINNIAWFLRHFPAFAIPGSGDYQVQPIFVEDIADLAVRLGQQDDNLISDAVGPEIFRFEDLVRLIASQVGGKARVMHLGPRFTLSLLRLLGPFIGDVILTREEIDALMMNLLVSKGASRGQTRFSEWVVKNRFTLGTKYSSELKRHYLI